MTATAAANCALTTRRLRLRPFAPSDGDALFTLYGDPGVMAIRKIGTQSRDQSDRQLVAICAHWRRRGFGLWSVHDRATGSFVGECGLREFRPGTDDIELSYGLLPSVWGNGLASEAAAAVVDVGFRSLGLVRILGIASASNAVSLRVLLKLGFQTEPEFAGNPLDRQPAVVRTALTSADWTARRAAIPGEAVGCEVV